MHKVKKNWVAIAVTSLALLVAPKALGLESGVIYADDANQVTNVKEQSAVQSKDSEQTTSDKATDSSQLEVKEQASSSKETYQASAATNPTANEQTTQQDKEVETSRTDSRHELTQKTSDDSSEKSGSSQEPKVADQAESTDKTQAALQAKQDSRANDQEETTENVAKATVSDKIIATPKKERLPEPAQRKESITEKMLAAQAQAAPVNTEHDDDVLAHIKTIDGKKYYVQDDGTVKKNFAVELNGKILYFDAETGALVDDSY